MPAIGAGAGAGDATAAVAASAAAAAVAKQPRNVTYPEYKTDDDFSLWLSGYLSRIRTTFGFTLEENNKVQDELVRSISGKLAVGSALNTYNRLDNDDKKNYNRLVTRLTEEFTDPRAKKRFNACMHFNTRKKNQSLKDYMQAIIKDMERYAYTPATIVSVAGGIIPNPERETQGVRRFIEGIRNEKGKVDDDFRRHLEYHLQDEREMTWANAIKVASRYESVYDGTEDAGEESDSDSNSDEEVKAIATKKKEKRRSKTTISALADQVHENQIRITKMETAQERMSTAQDQLSAAQNTTNFTLQEISAKLDLSLAASQGGFRNQYAYQPRFQQQSYRYQQPRSQQQQLQLQQQQRARSFQQPRPQTYTFQPRGGAAFKANPAQNTWGGRTDQARQGSFGFNRRTPTTFPSAAPAAPAAPAATTTAAVATVEDSEIAAEELGDYVEEEEQVILSMSQFMSLANQAGVEVPEEGFVAAVDELNFC